MADTEQPGLLASNDSPVSQTAPTDKTPEQEIQGKIAGALREKYDEWSGRFGGLMIGLGLRTWQEYDQCMYQEMAAGDIAAIVTDEVTSAVGAEKKQPTGLLPSKMEAIRIARAMRGIARERGGMPDSPNSGVKSSATGASDITESQLTRDTARLGIFSHLRSEEKLELADGNDKPAHVFDVGRYLEEQAKPLAGMEGYESLAAQLEIRRVRPEITVDDFTENFCIQVPEDVARHHSRLCYGGIPTQYKRDILSQSQYKQRLFDPGVMIFALYEASVNVSDLEASKKRCAYQQPVAVRPNDKQMLLASYKKYERESFELFQLRELGTARTNPWEVQYRIGSALFCNYPDISHRWSRIWSDTSDKNMHTMRAMMQEISELIKDLPDYQPVTYREKPPVQKPGIFPEQREKYMCRDFQRTGNCTYESRTGKKCRFTHAKAKVMLASMSTQDMDVKTLQGTLNDLNHEQKAEAGEFIEKEHFKTLYDAVYMDTGTPKFANTHGELVMVFHEDLADMNDSDDGSADAAQQELDSWHIY